MKWFNFRRGHLLDLRVWILFIPAVAILAADLPVLLTLAYSLSAMLVIVAMAHVIRRILFHYIDLEEIVRRASETPTGSGYVFLGVSVLVAAIVLGSAIWVGK